MNYREMMAERVRKLKENEDIVIVSCEIELMRNLKLNEMKSDTECDNLLQRENTVLNEMVTHEIMDKRYGVERERHNLIMRALAYK